MADQEGVGHVNPHVQSLPDRRGEVRQPEVVAGHRHQREDDQRAKTQAFEGKVRQRIVSCVAYEEAHHGIEITVVVIPGEGYVRVVEREQAHGDTHVPPVVEKWQEAPVEPAERTDREDHVQQDEGRRPVSSDPKVHYLDVRVDLRCQPEEPLDVDHDPHDESGIVDQLLTVPADCAIRNRHENYCSDSADRGLSGILATTF